MAYDSSINGICKIDLDDLLVKEDICLSEKQVDLDISAYLEKQEKAQALKRGGRINLENLNLLAELRFN